METIFGTGQIVRLYKTTILHLVRTVPALGGSAVVPLADLDPSFFSSTQAVLQSWSIQQDGPISKVLVFALPTSCRPGDLVGTTATNGNMQEMLPPCTGDQVLGRTGDQA